MTFKWAYNFPDLYQICERFSLSELDNPKKVQYTELEGVLQEGPQCGLVALAICMKAPNKDIVKALYEEAKNAGFTYNGELFSAKDFTVLAQKQLSNKVTLYSGYLDCEEVKEFLLDGGLMLVPYDCDKNHSPSMNKGSKAHWAAVSGIIITSDDCYVIAKHGKSKNTAIWNLKTLADSNAQLEEFAEARKLSGRKYKIPEGGIGNENGLKLKSVCIWPPFNN